LNVSLTRLLKLYVNEKLVLHGILLLHLSTQLETSHPTT